MGLGRFPDRVERVRADPTLANDAVEELLRYDGPSGAQERIVNKTHELHGKTLEALRTGLVVHYGRDSLGQRIALGCFSNELSIGPA